MYAKKISLGILTSMLFALLAVGASAHAQTTDVNGNTIYGTNSTYQTVSPSPTNTTNSASTNGTSGSEGTMNTTNTTGTVGLPNTGVGGNMALTLSEIIVALAALAFGGVYLRNNLTA